MNTAMLTDLVGHFLLAVAVVVVFCHVLGVALGRSGQPAVVGELIGGLLLGPSTFGALVPAVSAVSTSVPIALR